MDGIISKRFCVTPRHDLGTCYNYSSIEINRIHDTLELDRKKRLRPRSGEKSLFEYRLSSENYHSNQSRCCERRSQSLNPKQTASKNGKFHAPMSCIIDLFDLFLGQLRAELVMNFALTRETRKFAEILNSSQLIARTRTTAQLNYGIRIILSESIS